MGIRHLKMCLFKKLFLMLWAQTHSIEFLAPKPSHDLPVTRPEQAPGGPTLNYREVMGWNPGMWVGLEKKVESFFDIL